MEKLCLFILVIFVNFLILSYIMYVHHEVKMPIRIKSEDIKFGITKGSFVKEVITELNNDNQFLEKLVENKERNFRKEMLNGYKLSKDIRILCWIMTTPTNHKTKAQKVKTFVS